MQASDPQRAVAPTRTYVSKSGRPHVLAWLFSPARKLGEEQLAAASRLIRNPISRVAV